MYISAIRIIMIQEKAFKSGFPIYNAGQWKALKGEADL